MTTAANQTPVSDPTERAVQLHEAGVAANRWSGRVRYPRRTGRSEHDEYGAGELPSVGGRFGLAAVPLLVG